ncbi:linear amide C-N hydrolase [Shewanella sp. YLB-07]|uniref:linear amide C-N hydrolase n=1 Tax=Shewanella sp. YLB-07 TaxID=2601268 RepID=UPI00128C275C|nr:linear amide C-N hydrolase [Shewanella sp. YLB-07]MPY24400.1 linear amide C-N hydrolase [Shewanella sp. YLB-07]
MKKTLVAISIVATATVGIAQACTTAVYNNGDAHLTVRTMDWFGHDDAVVVGTGVGMVHTYSETDGLKTPAKYAAMKIESFTPGLVAEAMNEEGLEARILYLSTDAGTQFAEDRPDVKNVDAASVPRWAVDNFATVADVINALDEVDVIPTEVCDLPNHEGECLYPPVHYQFTDAQGNTAVVEFIDGKMQAYTEDGSAYMSNDPEFSVHLILDAEATEAGSTIRAYDRRLRAKSVIADMYARDVTDNAQAKASIKAVGATVFAGYDQVDPYVNNVFPTLWTIYTDRDAKEWQLDRYDTWHVERYGFDMFDGNEAKRVVLGTHPKAQ